MNDVPDLSKVEAWRAEVGLETVDVTRVAKDVVVTRERLARLQVGLLSRACPEEARFAFVDLARLRQGLLNLVNNSCKFTRNGRISLHVARLPGPAPGRIHIRVRNTAVGIPRKRIGQLCQPFMQVLDTRASREFDGTGRRLAIDKKSCEWMAGDISVESLLGKGAGFTVRVPGAPC